MSSKVLKAISIMILFFIFPSFVLASPEILNISGNLSDGNEIVLSGNDFGTRGDYNNLGDTWGGDEFLNFRFKDFEDNQIESDGFYLGMDDSYNIQSGGRSGSNYYGSAFYGTSEERVWHSVDMALSPTTVYSTFWFMMPPNTQSGKFFRIYFGSIGSSDIYLSTGCDGRQIRGASECNEFVNWGTGPSFGDNTWHRVEVLIDNLGNISTYMDGTLAWSYNNWTVGGSCSWSPNGHTMDFPNMIDQPGEFRCASHPTWEGSYNYDDIFIDFTQARVEICDGSTWANRGVCEIQLPKSWSNSSLSFLMNQGAMSNLSNKYLYVVDSFGSVNTAGHSVIIGSGSGDTIPPVAPVNLSVL
ncbi:MAG: hypothetical protein V3574_03865 [Candidatus Moraniibacteriota bacterium]